MRAAVALVSGLALLTQGAVAQPAEPVGRYQIFMGPHAVKQTFLLDTVTGQVWALTQYSSLNGEPLAWDSMTRITTTPDLEAFIRFHGRKAPQQQQQSQQPSPLGPPMPTRPPVR